MWTPTTRQQHSRAVKRYQTDLTDSEWHVIAPHLPRPCATGRPREWPMREILRAGCRVLAQCVREHVLTEEQARDVMFALICEDNGLAWRHHP